MSGLAPLDPTYAGYSVVSVGRVKAKPQTRHVPAASHVGSRSTRPDLRRIFRHLRRSGQGEAADPTCAGRMSGLAPLDPTYLLRSMYPEQHTSMYRRCMEAKCQERPWGSRRPNALGMAALGCYAECVGHT
jgi:hypothetical protein